MRVETLLPLGKLDPGLRAAETPLDLRRVGEDAQLVEALGYDGLAVEETKDDPYVVMALAAQATTRLRLTTAIAMAFPRSPTITAMSAWTIQKLSGGRFVLGLGSQVRGHGGHGARARDAARAGPGHPARRLTFQASCAIPR